MRDPHKRPSRPLFVLLVLACLTMITLDSRGGSTSPLDPLRSAVGNVLGPAETGTAAAIRPFEQIGGFFRSNHDLRGDVARLEAKNTKLKNDLATTPVDRNRLAEYDALMRTAQDTGYAMVPARVIAMGPMQSFSRTATIDAGTSSGVHADLTVVSNSGLVGRVIRATRTTATVLLIVDSSSVVGGRLGSNNEIGFVRGRGVLGEKGRLDLDLVDDSLVPARKDVVVTWGSDKGSPYVAGIPIGTVTRVFSSPRELSRRAVLEPFVDFSSLDVVGVVVPGDTKGDRSLVRADGGTR